MYELDVKRFRQLLGMSARLMAEKMHVSTKTIDRWEEGIGMTKANRQKLLDLAKESLTPEQFAEFSGEQEDNAYRVPLIPYSAQGGSLDGFGDDGVVLAECEQIVCPIPNATIAIPVSGNSMYPDYPDGSIVFVKRVDEKVFIEWGRAYVLDTTNGSILKVLAPSKDKECVKCVSINDNERYAPFEVEWESVRGVYKVLGMFRRD